MVGEEQWPADYPKIICYGKERPRDLAFLCHDRQVRNLMMVLPTDEVV